METKSIALFMEAVSKRELSVILYQTTRRNILDESHLRHECILIQMASIRPYRYLQFKFYLNAARIARVN
jgi:hypothetical protein